MLVVVCCDYSSAVVGCLLFLVGAEVACCYWCLQLSPSVVRCLNAFSVDVVGVSYLSLALSVVGG